MAQEKKSKQVQSLIDFVLQLKKLNSVEVEIPKNNINQIIKDPEGYAQDLTEMVFIKNITRFLEAYKLGQAFGKELKNGHKD